ncbi:MAG TPA: Maf family protein [Hyphomicrobiaceae bacterium]|nr:Maf family protein [Hyphomicrobiaceae bacterium]
MANDSLQQLVLASASPVRRLLLENAGIGCAVVPSGIDEGAIREALAGGGAELDPGDVAEVLARAKAEDVSTRNSGSVVVAADQVLAMDGKIYEKPRSDDEARSQLLELRGRTHTLYSAVVLASDGHVDWCHVGEAQVALRQFSATFLGRYLASVGPDVRLSVGCYQLEARGVQLIETVAGDYFTVLGLPMLPLLEELRRREVLAI